MIGIIRVLASLLDIDQNGKVGLSDATIALAFISVAAAALTVMVKGVTYVRKRTSDAVLDVVGPKLEAMEERMVAVIEEIRAQLVPNGGSSLRDAMDAIDGKIADLHTEMSGTFDRRSEAFAEAAAPWMARIEQIEANQATLRAGMEDVRANTDARAAEILGRLDGQDAGAVAVKDALDAVTAHPLVPQQVDVHIHPEGSE